MDSNSVSTCGGATYDELCRGTQKNYSFNLVCLHQNYHQYQEAMPFAVAAETLKIQIKKSIEDIERQNIHAKEIESFVIGKSHAKQRKKRSGGRSTVHCDCMNRNTLKLGDGISARWRNKYLPEGYDGLVVLAAITRTMVPKGILDNQEWMNQEQYAIALEQRLISMFMLEDVDSRIDNESFETGKVSKTPPYAGIVYFAYKLSDTDGLKETEEYEDDHPQAQPQTQPYLNPATTMSMNAHSTHIPAVYPPVFYNHGMNPWRRVSSHPNLSAPCFFSPQPFFGNYP